MGMDTWMNSLDMNSPMYQNSMLLSALKGLGGGVSPYLSLAGGFAGGLADFLGGGQERKARSMGMGIRSDVYNKAKAAYGSPAISHGNILKMLAQAQAAAQPAVNQTMWQAGKGTGMGPQAYGSFANFLAQLRSGQMFDLQKLNATLTPQKNLGLLRTMLGSAGGY